MSERRPNCGTCRFWSAGEIDTVGECRRHAPVPHVRSEQESVATVSKGEPTVRWPEVRASDWCGEHQPRKTLVSTRPDRQPTPERRPEATRTSSTINGLSARTKKVIALLGVTTWEQLSKLTTEQVRGQKGTGVGTISELRDALQENGLTFSDER